MTGKVKFYNEVRGYGFITGDDGKDVFVHVTGINGDRPLSKGQRVKYETIGTPRGTQAEDVEALPEEEEGDEEASE